MALALEDGQRVWLKVQQYLTTHGVGGPTGAALDAFRTLKDWMVGAKGNPQLQFIPFSDADITQDTGLSPIAVPCTFYAIYVKKGATATDSYVRVYNQASNTTITLAFVGGILAVANDEFYAVYPKGIKLATDLTISADTGAGAGAESTGGDAGDGFVIVGAL